MAKDSFILDLGDDDDVSQQLEQMEFGDDMGDMSDDEQYGDMDMNDDDFRLEGFDDLGGGDEPTLEGFDDLGGGDDQPALEGFDDLRADDDEAQGEGYVQGPVQKRARPAFFPRSIRAVERSALRTNVEVANSFIIQENGDFLKSSTSRVPGTWGRINRDKGSTLPAYHKKVSYDLDSDDELMMEMREKGFSDRQIAEKLAKDGRVRYDVKSISTRIARIRQVQAEHVDWLLKEGYMEWRLEDDQLLMRAFDLADIEVRYEIERVRAWRFRKVAEYMRRLNKEAIFSGDACRDRYSALINGTATIPIDEDDHPDARRLELEQYRSEREAERAAEQAKKDKKEAEQRRIKEEAMARQAKKAAEIAAKRQEHEQNKAARMMHRAAQAQIRSQRAMENRKKKAERSAAIEAKREAEKEERERREMMKLYAPANFKNITADSPDPRFRISVEDLRKLCADRGLSAQGIVKDVLVKRLRDADENLTSLELRQKVKEKGISLGGSKLQMKYQLALNAALSCDSYQDEEDEENEEIDDAEDTGELVPEGGEFAE